jgi:hypothetical protein
VADLFINPNLPNYFHSASEVVSAKTARSFVPEFESGKVITLPNFKADIDYEFWARLDTKTFPGLRKFGASLQESESLNMKLHREALIERGIPASDCAVICEQMQAVYNALLPLYRAIFGGYRFSKRKVVWRLNTTRNENMHLDVYADERPEHLARMFINLDTQPRIWQTSWPVDKLLPQLKAKFPQSQVQGKSRTDLWKMISLELFGESPREWWDDQPRHAAFFDTGDIWLVDSRQVAHQIFYGRRALSIDFAVERESMADPSRHYLSFVDRFREDSAVAPVEDAKVSASAA